LNINFYPSTESDPNKLLAELNTRLVENLYEIEVNLIISRMDYERLGNETFRFLIENNLFAAAKRPITWEVQ
jgi:hypothetical protein